MQSLMKYVTGHRGLWKSAYVHVCPQVTNPCRLLSRDHLVQHKALSAFSSCRIHPNSDFVF